ncbi:MAG: hypothetical protein JRI80_19270 [Deltaproteobacteria bacterium]|nr:hypothetical protein [Deltaproteobacteria bacterium]
MKSLIGLPREAGERDVPGAASCRPWNRTVEGPTSAVSGAMDGEANVAEGICRFPASQDLFCKKYGDSRCLK